MDLQATIFEMIDMRSFSNLWFWIVLAVMWSSASHYVLGVPYDLVTRARRTGGQAQIDLEDLVRINVNRMLHIIDTAGIFVTSLAFFLLASLVVLGFVYRVEFAQAVFLLSFPMSIVAVMSLATSRRIKNDAITGSDLHRRLSVHRIKTQAIGVVSIFITAIWGMYTNFSASALG